jgi:hypothetical protein
MKRLVVGAAYLLLMAATSWWAYDSPIYRFNGAPQVFILAVTGVAVIMVWRRRDLSRIDWILAAALVLTAMASFPNTSRDHLRYLFDGEMIRLFHESPYVHLPYEFPVDQYSIHFQHIWWTSIPSPYGPLWQALMGGINWLSGNQLVAGVVALKLLNLVGLLVCGRYIFLITRKSWLAFSFVINPVILLNSVATPHPDIVIAALILVAYHNHREPVRGSLQALAGAIKFHAVMYLPFMSKSLRSTILTGAWMLGTGAVVILSLMPWLGFDLTSMLKAGLGGGVTGMDSLLLHNLFPSVPSTVIALASYGLFSGLYILLMGLYATGRLRSLDALIAATFLVPLCLTGVLLPWHFILPIAALSLNERPWASLVIIFLSLTVLRSAVNAAELVALAGLIFLGIGILKFVYRNLAAPDPKLAKFMRSFE